MKDGCLNLDIFPSHLGYTFPYLFI